MCRLWHKFVPRYDSAPMGEPYIHTENLHREYEGQYDRRDKESFHRDEQKTYVQDICVRCGIIVKR